MDNVMIRKKLANLWSLVGNTPMLELHYTYQGQHRKIYVKCEHYNLTGSIKDRMALYILQRGYELGTIKPGDTILFQGDSITDAGRKRDDSAANSDVAMGRGYAWLAAAQLLIEKPDAGLKIFNRGISGNKVYQLAERWQADCLDLKPNVLSILIGVNDFWHKKKHNYDGTLEKYEGDFPLSSSGRKRRCRM